MDTTPTSHSPNAVLMLGKHLRRWPNIEPTLEKCTMFKGKFSCLLGVITSMGSARFEISAVIQSVCLQTKAQLRARAKGFELWWNY